METNQSESIRILLLSDIHMMSPHCVSNVPDVEEKIKKDQTPKYDYVFVSGDIANLPNKTGVPNDAEFEKS
jgi:predicted MPP superfamily phosphohydrolase